jgi:hypothetical protein
MAEIVPKGTNFGKKTVIRGTNFGRGDINFGSNCKFKLSAY